MKLAVCLYKYFPFGGLARDFLRIMEICRDRGDSIDVYVMQWSGDIPAGFNIHIIPSSACSNHGKVAAYIKSIKPLLADNDYDLIIGFNKIPSLDLYYAADPCYLDRVKQRPGYFLQQWTPRLRFYKSCEAAVFSSSSNTVALMISDVQRELFKLHYKTADQRLIMLSPGIDQSRKRPENWQQIRTDFRQQLAINDDEIVLLMVGTAFKTKGVDRAIEALASLDESVREKCKLFIVGEGDSEKYMKLARQLSVENKITFFGGRSDIPQFLLAADVLLHPARKENTGTVILEAMVAGLPVLVSDVCGYAKYVSKSAAGLVNQSPFKQQNFNQQLLMMLDKQKQQQWTKNGLAFAKSEDLYSMPQQAAALIETMAVANKKAREQAH